MALPTALAVPVTSPLGFAQQPAPSLLAAVTPHVEVVSLLHHIILSHFYFTILLLSFPFLLKCVPIYCFYAHTYIYEGGLGLRLDGQKTSFFAPNW